MNNCMASIKAAARLKILSSLAEMVYMRSQLLRCSHKCVVSRISNNTMSTIWSRSNVESSHSEYFDVAPARLKQQEKSGGRRWLGALAAWSLMLFAPASGIAADLATVTRIQFQSASAYTNDGNSLTVTLL
jgi:hypothetical protein